MGPFKQIFRVVLGDIPKQYQQHEYPSWESSPASEAVLTLCVGPKPPSQVCTPSHEVKEARGRPCIISWSMGPSLAPGERFSSYLRPLWLLSHPSNHASHPGQVTQQDLKYTTGLGLCPKGKISCIYPLWLQS